ncbi:MAG TPA: hypothetical protein V6D23_24335 [Candidatus Obscuribacterales bacterium]
MRKLGLLLLLVSLAGCGRGTTDLYRAYNVYNMHDSSGKVTTDLGTQNRYSLQTSGEYSYFYVTPDQPEAEADKKDSDATDADASDADTSAEDSVPDDVSSEDDSDADASDADTSETEPDATQNVVDRIDELKDTVDTLKGE